MARKSDSAKAPNKPAPPSDPRRAAVDALMRLAAARDWDMIELPDIAAEAGLDLGSLRALFPSKGAMLAGLMRMIDDIVLAGAGDELAGEPLRERLFDVMMRRFDALAPYRPALARMIPAMRRRPLDLAAMNAAALNSWRYMLASADIPTEDELGPVRLQGSVLVFSRVMETWLGDEDPGLAATMAALDRELDRAGRIMGGFDQLRRFTAPFRGALQAFCNRSPMRRRERGEPAPEAA